MSPYEGMRRNLINHLWGSVRLKEAEAEPSGMGSIERLLFILLTAYHKRPANCGLFVFSGL